MPNNTELMLLAFAPEIQELETVAFQLLLNRWLTTSIGQQLDNIGTIIGRKRLGDDDDTYRIKLGAQISLNRSSGTVPEIITILELIYPTVTFELKQLPPAAFTINADLDPLTTVAAQTIATLIGLLRAAGVRGLFQYYTTNPLFQFDGGGGSTMDGGYFFAATLEG